MERIGGWRPGGVRRVLIDPGLKGGDPQLEGLDHGEDGRLDIGRRLGPEVIRQWRLGTHPIWCNRPVPKAQALTDRERLRSPISASTASWMARSRSSISACFSGETGAVDMGGSTKVAGFPATIADRPALYKDSTNFRDAHRM